MFHARPRKKIFVLSSQSQKSNPTDNLVFFKCQKYRLCNAKNLYKIQNPCIFACNLLSIICIGYAIIRKFSLNHISQQTKILVKIRKFERKLVDVSAKKMLLACCRRKSLNIFSEQFWTNFLALFKNLPVDFYLS